MKLTIESVSNGATLAVKGDGFSTIKVFEFEQNNVQKLAEMFYEIKDHLCIGSRYDSERVAIKVEHGDKYDCIDPNCTICHQL